MSRRYRPHLLTEAEEKIMSEKSVTGGAAWSRLFSEVTSAIRVELDGEEEPVPLDVALARLMSPDRALRQHVAERVTTALQPTLRIRGYIYNTLMADKATDDRLRDYPSWISSRNLANEASDESVQALVEAVRESYEIPRRWYRLKARLLGLDRLADYDRMASVGGDEERKYDWDEAKDIVLSSFADFSDVLADGARRFFDEECGRAAARPLGNELVAQAQESHRRTLGDGRRYPATDATENARVGGSITGGIGGIAVIFARAATPAAGRIGPRATVRIRYLEGLCLSRYHHQRAARGDAAKHAGHERAAAESRPPFHLSSPKAAQAD